MPDDRRWSFYGRAAERADLGRILASSRFFFCSISGRRRIGKTTLIREALRELGRRRAALYTQIPDSDQRGVVQSFRDAVEDSDLLELLRAGSGGRIVDLGAIRDFKAMAASVAALCRMGVIVVLDEFQYFHRRTLFEFTSHLQAEIDQLRSGSEGGIFVLGSIHTEMTAVLEDRSSPLFNRVTHRIALPHWDFATLFQMFRAHGVDDPAHWLFLWTLFEGVPKFYRDVHEQDALHCGATRKETLRRLFFEGASPLKDEAANWFLRELRGRSDSVLKLIARIQPCSYGQLNAEYDQTGPGDSGGALSAYLKALIERYQMVELHPPVFARDNARKSRYTITDNFLSAWLSALSRNVDFARIRPISEAVARADSALQSHVGLAFEKMVRVLTEEVSRLGGGDLALSGTVRGYWNKADGSDVVIDLVAFDEDAGVVRFGSCKRSCSRFDKPVLDGFEEHIQRFLATREGQRFAHHEVQRALYSPAFEPAARRRLQARGYLCRDLKDFEADIVAGTRPPVPRSRARSRA